MAYIFGYCGVLFHYAAVQTVEYGISLVCPPSETENPLIIFTFPNYILYVKASLFSRKRINQHFSVGAEYL